MARKVKHDKPLYTLFPVISKRLETPDDLENYSAQEIRDMPLFEITVGEPVEALSRTSAIWIAEDCVPDEKDAHGDNIYSLVHVLSPDELATFIKSAQEALDKHTFEENTNE